MAIRTSPISRETFGMSKKISFWDKLKNAWKIFKTSFSFIGKDKSLLIIPFIMLFSGILFCVGLFLIFFGGGGRAGLYLSYILLMFFSYLWFTFLGAAQAWMVYEVAKGKDATLASGLKRAFHNFFDIVAFAFTSLAIAIISGYLRGKGRMGEVAGGFINKLAGIAGKLVLPAMIITERNFGDAVKQLSKSLQALPEIAAYEIGIGPLTFLSFWLGLGVAILFGLVFGFFTGIIVFALIALALIILSILVNQIYYTLVYLTLMEKKKFRGLDLKA